MASMFETVNGGLSRRLLLQRMAALGILPLLPSLSLSDEGVLEKPIPSSGETIPVIGLGTSRTLDVKLDAQQRELLRPVLQAFIAGGGRLIDSSPMYGMAESVTGQLLADLQRPPVFAATKVWTDGRENGVSQMNRSFERMGVEVMDLMQIHNLRDWRVHIKTLREWQERGRIRYVGITTSHGRAHKELERVLKAEQFDFVQLSYNVLDRQVEQRLLPLAADKGIAVLVNRPFQRGALFRQVEGQALPEWAGEIQCSSWAQLFLKYVVSHPVVTCAIPATSKLKHMVDNIGAQQGRLPDAGQRRELERLLGA